MENINRLAILSFLASVKPMLENKFHVSKIGLFGSFARGEETAQSDIDIIIDFQPNTQHLSEIKTAIKTLIKNEFGREVDLCREKYIKPYYRTQILKSAVYV